LLSLRRKWRQARRIGDFLARRLIEHAREAHPEVALRLFPAPEFAHGELILDRTGQSGQTASASWVRGSGHTSRDRQGERSDTLRNTRIRGTEAAQAIFSARLLAKYVRFQARWYAQLTRPGIAIEPHF
jgi:hypothetical protein